MRLAEASMRKPPLNRPMRPCGPASRAQG